MTDSWLDITEEDATDEDQVFSGVLRVGSPELVDCTNCGTHMFPVFTIHRDLLPFDIPTANLANNRLTLDVCPRCPQSLSHYTVTFEGTHRVVAGGYITDNRSAINPVDEPYQSRSVSPIAIAPSFWSDTEALDRYDERKYRDGVCHQLGGRQLRKNYEPIDTCPLCKGAVAFVGSVEYDDLNVPIYREGEGFQLTIGDVQSLNLFYCIFCISITYCLTAY